MSQGKNTLPWLSVCTLVPRLRVGFPGTKPRQRSHLDPFQVMPVDGAQHPEVSPDSTRYPLYLLTVSTAPNPTDDKRARQNYRLGVIRLQGKDYQRRYIDKIISEN
jgi:hypothetical protein